MQDLTSWESGLERNSASVDELESRFADQLNALSMQAASVQNLINNLQSSVEDPTEKNYRQKRHLKMQYVELGSESAVDNTGKPEQGGDTTEDETIEKASCICAGKADRTAVDEEIAATKLKMTFLKRAMWFYRKVAQSLADQEATMKQVDANNQLQTPQPSQFYSEAIFLLHTMELSFNRMRIAPAQRFLQAEDHFKCCAANSQSLAAVVLGGALLIGAHATGASSGATIGVAAVMGVGVLVGAVAQTGATSTSASPNGINGQWKEMQQKIAHMEQPLTVSEIIKLHEVVDDYFLKPLAE